MEVKKFNRLKVVMAESDLSNIWLLEKWKSVRIQFPN